MDLPEIFELLKESLTIEVDQETGFYGEKHTTIKLILDGTTISEASLDLDL